MDPGDSILGPRPERDLVALRPAIVTLSCVLGVTVAGVVDWVTGYELRVYPLYYVPIAWGAMHLRHSSVAALALASAGVWLVVNSIGAQSTVQWWMWLLNYGAQAISFVLVGGLVTELRQRLRAEQSLARIDPLTQLANKRAFREQAMLLVGLAQRTGAAVTFAYLDLDNFKRVNDELGHGAGDRVLESVGAILRRSCRAGDVFARTGGDEFVLVLSNTNQAGARAMLERLREEISVAMVRQQFPVTVSVGALWYRLAPATLDAAVQAADELMYRAKREGKDRLHFEVV